MTELQIIADHVEIVETTYLRIVDEDIEYPYAVKRIHYRDSNFTKWMVKDKDERDWTYYSQQDAIDFIKREMKHGVWVKRETYEGLES